MTRIRTWVVAATTQSTNHYTITADAGTRSKGRSKHKSHLFLQKIGKKSLPGGESNPGLPRDRRRYSPLYYRGQDTQQFSQDLDILQRLRPHHVECTGSRLNTGVSNVGRGQDLDGRPLGNTGCCKLFLFHIFFFFFFISSTLLIILLCFFICI